jgi:hypothetical protein
VHGIPLFEQGDARSALRQRCRRARISIRMLDELVQAELEQVGKRRRSGLFEKFDELLGPNPSKETGNEED